jgi:hypothetical protein
MSNILGFKDHIGLVCLFAFGFRYQNQGLPYAKQVLYILPHKDGGLVWFGFSPSHDHSTVLLQHRKQQVIHDGCSYAQVEFYLQRQVAIRIWPIGCTCQPLLSGIRVFPKNT